MPAKPSASSWSSTPASTASPIARRPHDCTATGRTGFPPQPSPPLPSLVSQLRHVGVLLLAAAAVISLAIGQTAQAMAVAAVLAATVGLAVAAAWRARRPTRHFTTLAPPQAAVLRQGRLAMVDAASLVQGDLIQFDSGSRVPADARLVHAVDLCVLETALTGEPLPVAKTTEPLPAQTQRLGDRANMIHMGTVVLGGSGRGIVTATGASTELGRIVTLVDSIREEDPPFTRQLDTLGRRAAAVSISRRLRRLPAGAGARDPGRRRPADRRGVRRGRPAAGTADGCRRRAGPGHAAHGATPRGRPHAASGPGAGRDDGALLRNQQHAHLGTDGRCPVSGPRAATTPSDRAT